ncbi:MAG: hypothetical protein RL291_388 [Pseudomonadota bacterium]
MAAKANCTMCRLFRWGAILAIGGAFAISALGFAP